jgi:hypothetical protein
MPHWKLEYYQQIYTDAMLATGAPDAKYTRKSAMYRAVVDAVNEGSPMDLIQKLCACVPGLRRVDVEELEMLIGRGWKEGELFVRRELKKVLDVGGTSV